MDNRNMASKITIREEWHPTNDWDSHKPMLFLGASSSKESIIEFGCGYGSTKLLDDFCKSRNRHFHSFETNKEWSEKFPETTLVPNYDLTYSFFPCSMLFIDNAPGELRKYYIAKHAGLTDIIIVHDTEPGAEYVYGLMHILNQFKYRCDLVIEGMPQTTAVSNTYDFGEWKGLYNDKFLFK